MKIKEQKLTWHLKPNNDMRTRLVKGNVDLKGHAKDFKLKDLVFYTEKSEQGEFLVVAFESYDLLINNGYEKYFDLAMDASRDKKKNDDDLCENYLNGRAFFAKARPNCEETPVVSENPPEKLLNKVSHVEQMEIERLAKKMGKKIEKKACIYLGFLGTVVFCVVGIKAGNDLSSLIPGRMGHYVGGLVCALVAGFGTLWFTTDWRFALGGLAAIVGIRKWRLGVFFAPVQRQENRF